MPFFHPRFRDHVDCPDAGWDHENALKLPWIGGYWRVLWSSKLFDWISLILAISRLLRLLQLWINTVWLRKRWRQSEASADLGSISQWSTCWGKLDRVQGKTVASRLVLRGGNHKVFNTKIRENQTQRQVRQRWKGSTVRWRKLKGKAIQRHKSTCESHKAVTKKLQRLEGTTCEMRTRRQIWTGRSRNI